MKKLLIIALTLLLAIALVACAGNDPLPPPAGSTDTAADTDGGAAEAATETDDTAEAAEEAAGTGGATIVFAQHLQIDEEAANLTQALLDEYAEHSGNTIVFEAIPFEDFRTWTTTHFTAGTGPNVYTSILYDVTPDFFRGWIMDFQDLYNQESRYDPGHLWRDTLPEAILQRMIISPDGEIPGYPTSTSVVRIFINMELFDAAGATIPDTWQEFMDACQLLRDSGTIPFAFPNASHADLAWLWFNNSVSSQLNSGLLPTLDVSGNGFIELNEKVRGMELGLWDFNVPQLQAGYELMNDFSQHWTMDYNSLDRTTATEMFLRGDAAMIIGLSGDLRMITEVAEFEFAVMPVPVITTETSQFAQNRSVVLGGQPDGIFTINASLEGSDLDETIDFVQWMASPDVQYRLATTIYRIPLSTSVDLPPSLAGFIITEDHLRLAYYTGINEQVRTVFHRTGQQFLEGLVDVAGMTELLNEAYIEILGQIGLENDWNEENNFMIEVDEFAN